MSDQLYNLLDAYNANTLREAAEANHISIFDNNGKKLPKNQLMGKMRRDFFTKERILAAYQRLTNTERKLLELLQQRGGQAPTRRFKRIAIRSGLAIQAPDSEYDYNYRSNNPYGDGYTGSPHHTDSDIFEDIIARLTWHGLVFSRSKINDATYKLRFHPAAEIFIPQIIQKVLPAPPPVEDSTPDWQPVAITHSDPSLFLRNLYLYWDFVRRNEISLLTSGLVGKRTLKSINQLLLSSDPKLNEARREDDTGLLYLLRLLLESLSLIQTEYKKLEVTTPSATQIPGFWKKPQPEQVGDLLEIWQSLTDFHDITHETLKDYGANLNKARQTILEVIGTLPGARWIHADELIEEIQFKNPDFLIPERSLVESAGNNNYYYSRYSSTYYYGNPQTLLNNFDAMEEMVIDACVSGFLRVIGVVKLGKLETGSPDEPWSVFRLTPLGLQLLKNHQLSETPKDTGKVLVQPNFQVVAIGPVEIETLALLDLFAAREQVDPGAFQYRLSKDSVYQAQQLGLSAADITRILLEKSHQDSLPQNVRRSLDEWGSHHERIIFRQGVNLMQTADAALLNKLQSDKSIARLLAHTVTDTVTLVNPKKQTTLINQLMAQSLLPVVSDANPQSADRSVLLQADGTLTAIHAVPSLLLRGRLNQLAEAKTHNVWQLTPDSIGQAGGDKRKVLEILDELKALSRNRLPKAVVESVKKWGGYYGQVAAQTVTLLEFSDRAIMEELCAAPAFKEVLTVFPTKDRALVIVAPDKLAHVKTALSELGITVKDGLLSN